MLLPACTTGEDAVARFRTSAGAVRSSEIFTVWLLMELRPDRERFQRYFRLDVQQLDTQLMKMGPLIAA